MTTDGVWTASRIGKLPIPIITNGPCASIIVESEGSEGSSEENVNVQKDEL